MLEQLAIVLVYIAVAVGILYGFAAALDKLLPRYYPQDYRGRWW